MQDSKGKIAKSLYDEMVVLDKMIRELEKRDHICRVRLILVVK